MSIGDPIADLRLAARAGMRKAKVALARKLAVILLGRKMLPRNFGKSGAR